jgi:hypothetical protein
VFELRIVAADHRLRIELDLDVRCYTRVLRDPLARRTEDADVRSSDRPAIHQIRKRRSQPATIGMRVMNVSLKEEWARNVVTSKNAARVPRSAVHRGLVLG